MKEFQKFKLIDGIFNPMEAQKILMELIGTKINYHSLEAFSNNIRFNTEITKSKTRIDELSKSRELIKKLVLFADKNDLELKINTEIIINLVSKNP